MDNKSDQAKGENLIYTPLEEDLKLPLNPTCMDDMSKNLVKETIDVNIGMEKDPKIVNMGDLLSLQEQKTFTLLLREFIDYLHGLINICKAWIQRW